MSDERRPEGFLSIASIVDRHGDPVSFREAQRRGWIKADGKVPTWVKDFDAELPLGKNLFTDSGRQLLCYCFADQNTSLNSCKKFGIGTGTTAPKVTDTSLTGAIVMDGLSTRAVTAITFPTPFVARVEFNIAAGWGNGYLITELGLYSGGDTLMARRTLSSGINKTSDFSPTIVWRVRC